MNDTPLGELLDGAPAEQQGRKKRVRATIVDTVAISQAIMSHGEVRSEPDDITEIWSYERGYSDERIAKEYVPHLAAHHVTTVREALYPKWERHPADITVEERLEALEGRLEALEKWAHEDSI